jgi:sodium transport system permease protein
MIRALRTVLSKELLDAFRDRRTVSMALLFPLLGPAVLALAIGMTARDARTSQEQSVKLPVVGREHAPNLLAFLEAGGAEIVDPPADPQAAVRAGDVELVLIVPPEYPERLREGRPAPVRLVVDESRRNASSPIDRVEGLLGRWASRTAAQRLILRGVHPTVAEPLAIERLDVSTPQSRAALVLGAMPYFLVLSIFIGGMSSAIDSTAGERERQSLEPLLANPVPRAALVGGKVLAAAVFSAIALGETLAGFALLPIALPMEQLGYSIRLEPAVLLGLLALFLPLVLAGNALMVLLAARAKTFRAAQTSLSFIMLVPAIPGMVIAFSPVKLQTWMMLVPALGEQTVAARILRGEQVPVHLPLLAMAATLAFAVALTVLAVRRFEGEKLLF